MAIKPEIMEFISAHADKVVSEAASILKTVTNKDVELTFEGASEFSFETLQSNYAESVVEVSFTLASDPEGIVQLFFDKGLAARIGSIMMMMEEEEPEFTEEHVDAMQETVNQILGSIATNMTETLGFPLSFENIKGEETELSEENFARPDMITFQFAQNLTEGDNAPVFGVITASTIESAMVAGGTEETSEEATVEEVIDAEETTDTGEEAVTEETGDDSTQAELSEEELAEIGSALGTDMDIEDEAGEGDLDSMLAEAGEMPEVEEIEHPKVDVPAEAETEGDPKLVFLMDLKFPVSIELGRTKMLIKDILDLGHGSVIEFDKLANEPVDLLIDDKKIAEGEVVVIDEHFGIRLTSLVHKAEWLKTMSKKH